MTALAEVRTSPDPPLAGAAQRLILRLWTSNPFYVLSAGVFLVGLYASFERNGGDVEAWALMSGLAGYTLLLAVTAFLLVRFAGAWDDLRTVLLLVVLMFLATSVTFDEMLVLDPTRGIIFYLAGFLFAIAVSEGLLRGIRLRLSALFRMPYYLILGLFFLYPLAIRAFLPANIAVAAPVGAHRSAALMWALFGFAPAASLVFVTLLPAIRRGADYVRGNGSPWRWPLYPWTLFGVLALAVPARAYLLCFSMHLLGAADHDHLIFGPYFVVPFGLTIAILLLEIGLVSSHARVLRFALITPGAMTLLAMIGHRDDPVYRDFLDLFIAWLGGTPLFLTLLAITGFYVFAALRRVRWATGYLTAALVLLSVVGPGTLNLGGLVDPHPLPLLAAAALQLGLGVARRNAWHCLAGGLGLAAAVVAVLPSDGETLVLRGPLAFHLVVLAVLVVGAAFRDDTGALLRAVGVGIGLVGCIAVSLGGLTVPAGQLAWWVIPYPLVMAALLAGYGWMARFRAAIPSAGVVLAVWLVTTGWRAYLALRLVVTGLDHLTVSLALFTVAVLISLGKSGLLARWLIARGVLPGRSHAAPEEVSARAP